MRSRHRYYYFIGFLPFLILATPFAIVAIVQEIRREAQFRASAKAFEEAIAETEQNDPNWRWEALQASLPDVPDVENLLLQIPKIRAWMGNGIGQRPSLGGSLFEEHVAINQLYDDDEIAELMTHQANLAKAVELCRNLENYPKARMRFALTSNPFSFPVQHPQPLREIVSLMRYEVEKQAIDNRPLEALVFIRGMLRCADAMNDDLFLISHLVRNACRTISYASIQRLLGLTVPGPELESVLKMLNDSATQRPLEMAFRGERAVSDLQFDSFDNGLDSIRMILGMSDLGSREPDREDQLTPKEYRPFYKEDRAAMLKMLQLLIDSNRLPIHEQRKYVESSVVGLKRRETPLTNTLLPPLVKMIASEQRSLALLHATRVGIACELFRQQNQRWPKTLEEIPKKWLPEIPLDPYDGKPIRYRIMTESIRVYSVGEDGLEESDRGIDEIYPLTTHQRFEIWNPEKRRLPGPPVKPEMLPDPKELPDPNEEPKE